MLINIENLFLDKEIVEKIKSYIDDIIIKRQVKEVEIGDFIFVLFKWFSDSRFISFFQENVSIFWLVLHYPRKTINNKDNY